MAVITTDKATERVGRSVNGSTKKYADEKSRNELNKIFTDHAYDGFGIGVCSTAADTAAKEVSIANFLLIKNAIVSVRFQKGIKAVSPTLNVNSQGAKPILLNGIALPVGVVAANTTVMLQYDGTNWNVVGSPVGLESEDELLVDLGLTSGLLWATRNIDVSQPNGFAASPYQYECSFFSWGNTNGHNPIATNAFDYDFGSANDGPYASTPGALLTGNISLGYDAAFANLGNQWRMPTTEEFAELFAAVDYINPDGTDIAATTADKRVTVNGVLGLYLKSKNNGKRIFFPCSGLGSGTSWYYRGAYGYSWSSSLYSAAYGRYLYFYTGGVYPQNYNNRFYGLTVRPVQ